MNVRAHAVYGEGGGGQAYGESCCFKSGPEKGHTDLPKSFLLMPVNPGEWESGEILLRKTVKFKSSTPNASFPMKGDIEKTSPEEKNISAKGRPDHPGSCTPALSRLYSEACAV